MGSFSRVFHKISSAYGWSDNKIKKLTIRRMRQISAEIDQAAWIEKYHQRQLVAWQTRMLCSWLVKLTPDMSPETAKKMMEEAASISLDGTERQENSVPTVKMTKTSAIPTTEDFYNMSDEEIEQYLGKGENREGSFESFRTGFVRSLSRPN